MKKLHKHVLIPRQICFILAFLFISCNQPGSRHNTVSKLTSDDSLKLKLIGKWGNREYKDGLVWDIRPDSIYYYSRSRAFAYKIVRGNLFIDLPESKGELSHVSVVNDTMFFSDPYTPEIIIRADRLPD